MSQISTEMSDKVEVDETKKNEEAIKAGAIEIVEDNSSQIKNEEKNAVDEEPVVVQINPLVFNVIKAPKVCPPGYRLDSTGKCRRIL
jgi:hypothetical protein